MNEDALSQLSAEFKLWGVPFTSRTMNSGHVEIVWQATPDKEMRRYIIPKSSSDWRGPLNARSKIRQFFKQDGLQPLPLCPKIKPKSTLAKALQLPQPVLPVETDADQIKMLRAEIGDLTDLVLDLATTIKGLMPASAPAPVIATPTPPAIPPRKIEPKTKIIDHVTKNWNSTETIAREAGLTREMAYRKLYYLSTKNRVELSPMGMWRLGSQYKPNGSNGVHAPAAFN